MTSKQVLIIHTAIFVLFVLGCLSTPILAIYYPHFFASIFFLAGIILTMIALNRIWAKFGCPFTVWENHLLAKESKLPYSESCLTYYSKRWFHLNLSQRFFTITLSSLLVLQIFVSVCARLTS